MTANRAELLPVVGFSLRTGFYFHLEGVSMFDLSGYFSAAVQGIPLLFVVLGLVQWVKSYTQDPRILRGVSMLIGLLLGGGYLLADQGFPVVFAGWFTVVVYGLGVGVVASGIYDVGGDLLAKISK